MRPGDEKTVIILAMQDELTALGLLPPGDRAVRRLGRRPAVKAVPLSPRTRELRAQARQQPLSAEDSARAARLAAAEASAAEYYATHGTERRPA